MTARAPTRPKHRRRRTPRLATFTASWILVAACSNEERPAAAEPPAGRGGGAGAPDSGATADASKAGGENPNEPPGAGDAGAGGSAARGAEARGGAQAAAGAEGGRGGADAACGNGVLEGEEDCDGDAPIWVTCQDFGFDDGVVQCTSDCTLDPAGCTGTEDCYDGRDNDGDLLADCLDDADCEAACSDPCSDVPVLADPDEVTGNTLGSANLTDSSCTASGSASGAELAYELVAANTGKLDVSLDTEHPLRVSVRTSCDASSTELACAAGWVSVPVTEGDTLYVVVDGYGPADAGWFRLEVASRPVNVCGDGHRDSEEACDDDNLESNDGCSDTCQVEVSEAEPNDTVDNADPYAGPFYGQISSPGDEDLVAVTVSGDGYSTMRANAFNLGDGSCALGLMDSYIEILDAAGNVLAQDDNGADGLCARAVAWALAPGSYIVRVQAAPQAAAPLSTFPYQLDVRVDVCGNATVAAGEECDDGNTADGDGCSQYCRLEAD